MLVGEEEILVVVDFKTDALDNNQLRAAEGLYATQLEKYLAVARQATSRNVMARLLFLQAPDIL